MKKLSFTLFSIISTISFAQVDLLNTDFQTGIPVTYSIIDNDGLTPDPQVSEFTAAWITVQDPENVNDTVAASTSYFSPIGTADRWLITSSLTLGAYGNFIEWNGKSQDASYPDNYLVLISTTDTQIASFTDTLIHVWPENAEWTNRQIDLSANGYNNQTVYLAFVNVTENGFKLYIDDIHVWKEDPVGISEIASEIKASVYPNPTSGMIAIETDELIESVILMSSNGVTLSKTTEKTLDLQNFPTGVYFLNIISDRGVVTKKILKN